MLPSKSLLLAPMEGITDPPYRRTILELYPEWDWLSSDFLRIPTEGFYSDKKLLQHWGDYTLEKEKWRQKTIFQILAPVHAQVERAVKQLDALGVSWLDLNLGCPSRKVNSRGGGAYLLSTPDQLRRLVATIRKNFSAKFTVKMRTGYRDDKRLLECLQILQEEGVDAVTLHGRTRDQLYRGKANWDSIKSAAQFLTLPLIGNGDVWTVNDIDKMFHKTSCHSIMIARGALQTPWLARLYRQGEKDSLPQRSQNLLQYFDRLEVNYRSEHYQHYTCQAILKRFKALSRYLFDPYPNSHDLKKRFLRSGSLQEFRYLLVGLDENSTNPGAETGA